MTDEPIRVISNIEPFVISREFNAPRELMFRVWSEKEHLNNWWGPKGFKITSLNIDFRAGGTCHYCMKLPDGGEMWGKFMYREIVEPERIAWINCFSDAQGNITRNPYSGDWPLEMWTIITFEEKDGRTKVTVEWSPINVTAQEIQTFDEGRESMKGGWNGVFQKLKEYLEND